MILCSTPWQSVYGTTHPAAVGVGRGSFGGGSYTAIIDIYADMAAVAAGAQPLQTVEMWGSMADGAFLAAFGPDALLAIGGSIIAAIEQYALTQPQFAGWSTVAVTQG